MWRKSKYSNPNGECLEVDTHWAKSSYSFSNGNCIECKWEKSTRSGHNGNCLEWRKSTASMSNGQCLEWHTSSHSGPNGNCVETAGSVLVRDSKYARRGEVSPILRFTPDAWRSFISGIKAGDGTP